MTTKAIERIRRAVVTRGGLCGRHSEARRHLHAIVLFCNQEIDKAKRKEVYGG